MKWKIDWRIPGEVNQITLIPTKPKERNFVRQLMERPADLKVDGAPNTGLSFTAGEIKIVLLANNKHPARRLACIQEFLRGDITVEYISPSGDPHGGVCITRKKPLNAEQEMMLGGVVLFCLAVLRGSLQRNTEAS